MMSSGERLLTGGARARRRLAVLAAALSVGGRAAASSSSSSCPFDPSEFRPFTLQRVDRLSHNTKLLRFALPSPEQTANLPVASCIMVQGVGRDGSTMARPYTPISKATERGAFELLVKDYPQGNISSYLHKRKARDAVMIKGPFPKLAYRPNMVRRLAMLAGGTGIAPMVQALHRILDDPSDRTEVTLLFANVTEEDVLMKEWLAAQARAHPDRLKVVHVIEKRDGFVNAAIFEKHFPRPAQDDKEDTVMVLVCGPPPFMKAMSGDKLPDKSQGPVEGMLKSLGYPAECVYKF